VRFDLDVPRVTTDCRTDATTVNWLEPRLASAKHQAARI
jgi:hypothetical protein